MRRGLWVGAAIAAIMTLTACTPNPVPTPSDTAATTTSAPAVSETPSPQPTPEPTEVPAAQSFGGDCTAMFSDDELTALVGTTMTDLGANWSIGQEEAFGGVKCTWWSEGIYLGAVIAVTALPTEVAPAIVSDELQCSSYSERCEVAALTDNGWYSLTLMGSLVADKPAVTQQLINTVIERGDALPAPTMPEPVAGQWSRPTPLCADIATMLTSPEEGADAVTTSALMTDQESILAPLYETTGQWCTFATTATDETGTMVPAEFSLVVVPGGAVAYDAGVVSGQGVPLEITGGQAAVVIAPFIAEGDEGIFATDGANTVLVIPPRGFDTTHFAWVVEQLIAGLEV